MGDKSAKATSKTRRSANRHPQEVSHSVPRGMELREQKAEINIGYCPAPHVKEAGWIGRDKRGYHALFSTLLGIWHTCDSSCGNSS